MRLRRLDLTRYGKFTDHSIDFGTARQGSPDLHIVYGLNEAGKSTTFAAYLDLLYGIGERSTYNFLHPYNTMKVGARLEFGGSEYELARLKLRTGSLVDDRGQAVNEALLAGALGGVGREAYRTMFSLDDQSLKEGGNAIIQSKGELGELLFSASSGLAGLSRSLVTAADEANAIYKKRSSSTRLAELKRSLEALKAERNAIDTLASAYAGLKSTHEQAERAYSTTTRELAETKSRHQELTRLLGALPAALELRRLIADTAGMADLPRPPSEWYALLPQLSRDETRLQALVEAADRTLRQLADQIEAITIDEKGLAVAAHMDLLDQGRARCLAAESDLPKRRLALAEQEGMLVRLLADLEQPGHTAPEALLLPASLIGVVRDLIERRSGVEAKLAAAGRELVRAQENLERLNKEGGSQDAAGHLDPTRLGRIEIALNRLTGSDLSMRLTMEERTLVQAKRIQEKQFAQLAPWTGDAVALERTAAAEPRQIEVWRGQATSIDKRIEDHQARLRDLGTEQALTKARIVAIATDGSIDDGQAARLRDERDAAWEVHLANLNAATAQTFEERMRQDDMLSAGRLSRAQELAELRQLRQTEAATIAAIERQRELLAEARAEHEALCERLGGLLPGAIEYGAEAAARIAALEAWSAKRAAALSAWDDLQQAEDAVDALRLELDGHVATLAASLADAGHDDVDQLSVAELMQTANNMLATGKAEQAARQAHEKALDDLNRDFRERERDRQEADAAMAAWEREWAEALSRTWFADKAGSMAAVRAMLNALATLPSILKERDDLASRVAAMERDQQQFREHIAGLLIDCGLSQPAVDTLASANALVERHEAARHAAQLRADRQADLDKQLEKRRALEEELAVHNARKDELTGYFAADSLASVETFLNQSRERDRLEERAATLRHQITEALRAASFSEAEQRLDGVDAAAVERDAMELGARIEDLTERAKLLYSDVSLARQKLEAVGGDDAVARIEAKRRTIFLEIEELAVRHLTLRAGTLAAEQALHIYREKHRSSMMNRASEAFRLITGGNYSGLTTQPDRDKEILIGVSRDGGSKLADAMSTGTQFQLYLALRLAGYEEFAAFRRPVPFVADDIMESFDNPRSEEVFRLLGEMAKVGQVIYLTHHWHLCEIARDVVPNVTIHQLP
ncbi:MULTISPECIES: ATP-binding protein [Rhizobium]|uniref:ATP-binding protein n=1 Tax=Rhizobium TaxID=379 RepID=UPI0007EAE5EC|nr:MULTISPECIES: AAA family ATPase [Rhizobium]ANK95080.1 AAA domain-containing protein [Rhizobium sp. N6212]ANL01131.1 AAA domain-containing protein [Rhizobium sp. N621]ANL07254.1 AAA domain-containing protein [Rhizobium esperanzae]ANL13424.1 AAA domain-containing protein [Rhizobium sp. N1341]ANL25408.1 AAA domain-containing protein [Rhizobium sp. N113]